MESLDQETTRNEDFLVVWGDPLFRREEILQLLEGKKTLTGTAKTGDPATHTPKTPTSTKPTFSRTLKPIPPRKNSNYADWKGPKLKQACKTIRICTTELSDQAPIEKLEAWDRTQTSLRNNCKYLKCVSRSPG